MCRGDRVKLEFLAKKNLTSPLLRGRSQLNRLTDFVASVRPEHSSSLTSGVKQFCMANAGRGIVVLISDLMDKSGYESALRMLVGKQMDVFVLHLLSPAEIDPELVGDLKLVDCEDSDETEISVSPFLIRRYKQTLASFVGQAKQFCAQRGIAYMMVRSDQGADELVGHYLRERGLVR
jgi:uncharacterized protein (DUF58 family)